MSWQERMTGLQDLGSWELALLVGLDSLQTASRFQAKGSRPAGLLRGEGQGADINQVLSIKMPNISTDHQSCHI